MPLDTLKAAVTHLPDSAETGQQIAVPENSVRESTHSPSPLQEDTVAVHASTGTGAIDSTLLFRSYGFSRGNRQTGTGEQLHFAGVSGVPIPYKPSNDPFVVCALLVCLLTASLVASRSRHAIARQVRNFFRNRSRSETVVLKSESKVRHQACATILESAVLSILYLCYTGTILDYGSAAVSPHIVLMTDMAVLLVYFALKYVLCLTFNWTFFNEEKRSRWLDSYNLIALSKAVMLLPLMLTELFFGLPSGVCICIFLAILVLNELLVLCKTSQIFFAYPFGVLLSILYFCTLELLPLLFLWETLVRFNDYLLI